MPQPSAARTASPLRHASRDARGRPARRQTAQPSSQVYYCLEPVLRPGTRGFDASSLKTPTPPAPPSRQGDGAASFLSPRIGRVGYIDEMTLFRTSLIFVDSSPSVTTTAIVITPRTTAYSAMVWPASSCIFCRNSVMVLSSWGQGPNTLLSARRHTR